MLLDKVSQNCSKSPYSTLTNTDIWNELKFSDCTTLSYDMECWHHFPQL